ncbi:peptidylprolyl isomerase [uncultured Paracoccus sp.]|uniref:peptidylprolyl isomerase n=1 Tax=uncultured Paracoccus sp. TaxID=189685 RepID=UPI00260C80D0|nr:peptidylprolyl isomerase [uncultured Paracoccus sp.]
MEMKTLLPPVTVNGVAIDPALIAAEAQNHPAPKGKPGLAWRAAARALAIRELLLQEARRCGLTAEAAELSPGKWETEEEALIRQLLAVALPPAPVDEAHLRALYEARPERFRAPALYEAAHILFAVTPETAAAREKAGMKAGRVLAELTKSPRRFAELAAEHSACASKTSGGMLGQLSSGDTVPEFEAAMSRMTEGEMTLVESRYGVHILRLDARAEGAILPFDSVLPQLREAQEKAAWTLASRDFVAGLVAGAKVDGIDLEAPLGV